MSHDRGRRLDGWKEISAYTGVPPRTLQRWERDRRFPVRRLPGSTLEVGRAAKVYAFSGEIDAWMADGAHGFQRPELRIRRRLLWALISSVCVAGLFAGGRLLYRRYLDPPQPMMATLARDGLLTARAEDGSVLWSRHFTGGPLLPAFGMRRPAVHVGDWDLDGRNDVVLAVSSDGGGVGYVTGLDSEGEVRWTFAVEGPLLWGGEELAGRLVLWTMCGPGRLRDGRPLFAVVFNHNHLFPGTIAVLDGDGRLVGQYWNTGYIFDLDFIDVDADGQDEIVFGGINNRFDRPVVGLIDATVTNAISPVPAGYAPGLTPGLERAYRLIPRTPLAEAWQADSRVIRVDATRNGVIWVGVQLRGDPYMPKDPEERVYFLRSDLTPFRLELPDPYRVLHKRLFDEGKITQPLDDALIQSFMRFEDGLIPELSILRPPP